MEPAIVSICERPEQKILTARTLERSTIFTPASAPCCCEGGVVEDDIRHELAAAGETGFRKLLLLHASRPLRCRNTKCLWHGAKDERDFMLQILILIAAVCEG